MSADDEAREARRTYRNAHRAAHPDVAAVDHWYRRTYDRALRQLARECPARFLEILDGIREADPKPVVPDLRRRRPTT